MLSVSSNWNSNDILSDFDSHLPLSRTHTQLHALSHQHLLEELQDVVVTVVLQHGSLGWDLVQHSRGVSLTRRARLLLLLLYSHACEPLQLPHSERSTVRVRVPSWVLSREGSLGVEPGSCNDRISNTQSTHYTLTTSQLKVHWSEASLHHPPVVCIRVSLYPYKTIT